MVFQESSSVKNNHLPNAIIQGDSTWTALHEAAASGDEVKCQALLARNFDRTARSDEGNTPLHEASWRGYSRCVKLLCAQFTNSAKDKKQKASNTRLSGYLIDLQNNHGSTALHLAAQNGHNQSCRELLLAGADPNIKNNYGDTPLHTSCRYGHAGATRILISADCDPNKVNLNGDHPLHITCAMGRRKLTRLLLEADCELNLRNAQDETPRDIAVRKNFSEILEILKNPKKIRNRREKPKDGSKKSSLPVPTELNGISWSPYGCHYFPDPRFFPSPKLETLPKEPLKKGEQYYLDLAGHIRKGPIGIGNTCYCGPFFKHIEHKINSNRKSLRKYVYRTKECLDNKVQALAQQTNDQIEQLTRSVIADRERCENRRLQLNKLLQRGEPLRSTTEFQTRSKTGKAAALERSRSVEFVEKDEIVCKSLSNAKSCGGLLNEVSIIVHKADDLANTFDEKGSTNKQTDASSRHQYENDDHINEPSDMLAHEPAFLNEVLENASFLKDSVGQNVPLAASWSESNVPTNGSESCNNKASSKTRHPIIHLEDYFEDTQKKLDCDTSGFCDTRTYPSKSIHSLNAIEIDGDNNGFSLHDVGDDVLHNSTNSHASLFCNQYVLENMISTLHKDNLIQNLPTKSKMSYETGCIPGDKTYYKIKSANLLIDNSVFSPKTLAPNEYFPTEPKEDTLPYINTTETPSFSPALSEDQKVNGKIEKVEVKNSEIKTLRKHSDPESKSKRNKVQELVARLQGKLITAQIQTQSKNKTPIERNASQSESSEDEQNTHNEYKSTVQKLHPQHTFDHRKETEYLQKFSFANSSEGNVNENSLQRKPESFTAQLSKRLVPKDAYFHELPYRKRVDKNNLIVNALSSPNSLFHAGYVHASQNFESINEIPSRLEFQSNHTKVNHDIDMNVFGSSEITRALPFATTSNFGLTNETTRTCCNNEALPSNISHQNYVTSFERDFSNDSGVSTHFYNGPIGPSPSLSPQNRYLSKDRIQTLDEDEIHYNRRITKSSYGNRIHDQSFDLEYNMGKISSLV